MSRQSTKAVAIFALGLMAFAFSLTAGIAAAPKSSSDTRQFDKEITINTDLLDTHLVYLNSALPGQTWMRLRVGLQTTLEIDSRADIDLNNLDDIARGDSNTVKNKLKARGANVKDFKVRTEPFVNLDLAYDLFPRRCDADEITTDAQLTAAHGADSCLDFAVHTGNFAPSPIKYPLLRKNGLLPYSGTEAVEDVNQGFTIFDIGAFVGVPGVLVVSLDTDTHLELNATNAQGFLATRQISPANSPASILDQRAIHWTSPAPVNDVIQAQCSWPLNQDLLYRLKDVRWQGTANVTLNPQISLRLQAPSLGVDVLGDHIEPGVVLFGYDLPGVTLFDHVPVTVPADSVAHTMGRILPDTEAPTIDANGPYRGTEGSPVSFAATGAGANGSFDNCDPSGANLSYTWNFGDGSTASGRTPVHSYADNGHYAGILTVSDGSLTRTKNFAVSVANVAPVATLGVTATSNNTTPAATLRLSDAFDPSSVDTAAGFRYSFNCGIGYTPFGTSNSITCNGVGAGSTVQGRIRDKDNGTTEYTAIVPSPAQLALAVTTTGGDGTGSVTSLPAGIACPSDCAESYAQGDVVTLTANATATSAFVGWRGACSGALPVCTITMDSAKSVTAVFGDIPAAVLTVTVFDSLDGAVSSDLGSIACPGVCADSYPLGAVVHLAAVPGAGSTFLGWGGACVVNDTVPSVCTVTVDGAKSVTAQFTGPHS